MPGLPTAADLEDYAKATPATALRSAVNRLVAELGWDPRQSERSLAVAGRGTVVLPALNVTALTADPAVVGVRFGADGVVRLPHGWSGVLTYTAGWPEDDLPGVLADVVLEWAAERLDNPRNLRSWTTGTEAETYAVVTAAPSTGGDPRLDPYRVGLHVA